MNYVLLFINTCYFEFPPFLAEDLSFGLPIISRERCEHDISSRDGSQRKSGRRDEKLLKLLKKNKLILKFKSEKESKIYVNEFFEYLHNEHTSSIPRIHSYCA
jgi:hypothetical protein